MEKDIKVLRMGTGRINEGGLIREMVQGLAWVLKFWMLDFIGTFGC